MRPRRVAPTWLVDPADLMAATASRRSMQLSAQTALADAAPLVVEKSFIDGKTVLQLVPTKLPA